MSLDHPLIGPTKRRRQEAAPEWVTFDTAVNTFGRSRTQFYELLKAGRIRGKKDGTRTLLDAASIRADIEALPDFPGEAES